MKRDRRKVGFGLYWFGLLTGSAGALVTLIGSVAPWVQFSVFGVPLAGPGILFAGVWSALSGTLAFRTLARLPLLAAGCGLIAITVGNLGGKQAPRQVTQQMLSLRLRLAPINTRLEQVNLAPIEPFGQLSRSQDLSGPGPRWVVLGGALTLLGALAVALGNRWRRSCPQCRALWPESRLAELLHCPGCGFKRTDARQCPRCFQIALKTDKNCTRCGSELNP